MAGSATRSANVHDTVTLASLVEREAKLPEERPQVASVFHNRLRIGMKLDCDPTTVYAALLENRYRGVIHRSDLDSRRTTTLIGMRVCRRGRSPTRGSVRSAPRSSRRHSDYLYFVAKADGSGGHNFSASLAQHEAAVALYQRATRR